MCDGDNSSSQPASYATTTQSNSPWSGAQPFITTGLERAKSDILESPSSYYPNSTVVPFSNQTEQALQLQEARATAGSPVLTAGQNAVQSYASGDMMGPNPYLDQVMAAASKPLTDAYTTATLPGIDARFSASGRLSGANRALATTQAGDSLNRAIGDQAGKLAYENYGDQTTNQLRAASMAPDMANADYNNIAQLATVGQARESQAGANLQDQIARYYYNQQAPKDALSQYMALIQGGNYGGTSTTTSPIYEQSGLATGLGYASTAAGIGGSLFGANGIFGKNGAFGG